MHLDCELTTYKPRHFALHVSSPLVTPHMQKKITPFVAAFAAIVFIAGCATTQFPTAAQVVAPEPIPDNSGKYMSPYTSDGVVAEWVDKAIKAKMGAQVGGMIGAYAGQKAMEQVPFIGGFLGQKAGEAMGREIAVKASGGWEYIKETSDLSFHTVDQLSVWMYATHSANEHYAEVLSAVQEIYPEMKQRYYAAIQTAASATPASQTGR